MAEKPRSIVASIVGVLALGAGLAAFLVPLQHAGPYGIPGRGLAGGLACLAIAALLLRRGTSRWLRVFALLASPYFLFLALYGALAELEEVVGRAQINATKPDAELYVDGELVGRSPLDENVYLEVGKHTIEARLGTNTAAKVIDVVAGSRHDVRLEFASAPTPAPATATAVRPKPLPAKVPERSEEPADRSLLPALIGGTLANNHPANAQVMLVGGGLGYGDDVDLDAGGPYSDVLAA